MNTIKMKVRQAEILMQGMNKTVREANKVISSLKKETRIDKNGLEELSTSDLMAELERRVSGTKGHVKKIVKNVTGKQIRHRWSKTQIGDELTKAMRKRKITDGMLLAKMKYLKLDHVSSWETGRKLKRPPWKHGGNVSDLKRGFRTIPMVECAMIAELIGDPTRNDAYWYSRFKKQFRDAEGRPKGSMMFDADFEQYRIDI